MMAFLKPDESSVTVSTEDVIGLGQSGNVLRRGKHALKIANIRDISHLVHQQRREDQNYLNEYCT